MMQATPEDHSSIGEVQIEPLPSEARKHFIDGSRVKEAESVLASMRVLDADTARRIERDHGDRARWQGVHGPR
eukprot:5812916-Amphidinium_carterae.4